MRVRVPCTVVNMIVRSAFEESCSLGLEHKVGGRFHPKLNIGLRPIANKYCEGKVKRTLKRGLKVPEIAGREANETSPPRHDWILGPEWQAMLAQATLCVLKGTEICVVLSGSAIAGVLPKRRLDW